MTDVKITFEGMRYCKRPGESVLEALLRGGANVAFSCRRGSCHVCALQVTEGEVAPVAQRGLRAELVQAGLFKPCVATECGALSICRPDTTQWVSSALVHDKQRLSPTVFRLLLETGLDVTWKPGQFVHLKGPEGDWRTYSIASLRQQDYLLEVHIKHWPEGKVSSWVASTVKPGMAIEFRGPFGACTYESTFDGRPLLLVATGTGIAPLSGIAREALVRGHRGSVYLYHGARNAQELYLHEQLNSLASEQGEFTYAGCVSDPELKDSTLSEHTYAGRALDVALGRHADLTEYEVFLCGNPAAVTAGRAGALARGAQRSRIHADPFEGPEPQAPTDKEVLAKLRPDAELWRALGEGNLLRAILEEFYTRVYDDPQLAPFFHRVTKERAIQKQYEFVRDVVSGTKDYFGLRPFNAHHWMIISDELFDYRQQLFFDCVRRHGVAEHLARRWEANDELFRPDIVKSNARGLFVDGRETKLEGYSLERLDVATVCDGCGTAMASGCTGRMHRRTGELYCESCAARVVGESLRPASHP